MVWKSNYTDTVVRQLRRIDRQTAGRIVDYMDERTVRPPERLRMGSALASLGRRAGLTNEDFAIFDQVRDRVPAVPVKFE